MKAKSVQNSLFGKILLEELKLDLVLLDISLYWDMRIVWTLILQLQEEQKNVCLNQDLISAYLQPGTSFKKSLMDRFVLISLFGKMVQHQSKRHLLAWGHLPTLLWLDMKNAFLHFLQLQEEQKNVFQKKNQTHVFLLLGSY